MLNRSRISKRERQDSERALALLSVSQPDALGALHDERRLAELQAVYEVGLSSGAVDNNAVDTHCTLQQRLICTKFHTTVVSLVMMMVVVIAAVRFRSNEAGSMGSGVVNKRISSGMTVALVKKLCQRLFKLRIEDQKLYYLDSKVIIFYMKCRSSIVFIARLTVELPDPRGDARGATHPRLLRRC